MSESKDAFVIMQVGEDGSDIRNRADQIFRYVIKPTLQEFNVVPHRADLESKPGSITGQIITSLIRSKLVIADLTGRNANVFYELGIAHSFAQRLVCLCEKASELPFDTKDQRVIVIGEIPLTGIPAAIVERCQDFLREALSVVLADSYSPSSPVMEAAGSQSLDKLAPSNPVASELAQVRHLLESLVHRAEESDYRTTDYDTLRDGLMKHANLGLLSPKVLQEMRRNPWLSGDMTKWLDAIMDANATAASAASEARQALARKRAAKTDEPPF